jgi:hypothetical protein
VRRLLVLVAVAAAAVCFLQAAVDARLGGFRAQEEILYVWSGKDLERMSDGFKGVAADIYWLRTVQYFGGQRVWAAHKRFDLLAPLTEITTTLDPQFEIAYRYGATFLAEPYPAGAGQPQEAVALLQRGAAANPEAWLVWQSLAYFQFFFLHDADAAADTLLRMSRQPNAPVWCGIVAAGYLRQEGQRNRARAILRSIYERSEEGPMKDNARDHLLQLDAADLVDALNAAVQRFRDRTGRLPSGWQELYAAGVRVRPVDPTGVELDYDTARGVFAVSRRSPLWTVK